MKTADYIYGNFEFEMVTSKEGTKTETVVLSDVHELTNLLEWYIALRYTVTINRI